MHRDDCKRVEEAREEPTDSRLHIPAAGFSFLFLF